ncbi:hypothetical protein EDB83DRAFT_2518104 [Lactarius deliciosus]|nr:hypothetical protein EDB83DRAFT_2518104 [Lactarius deliciosus]
MFVDARDLAAWITAKDKGEDCDRDPEREENSVTKAPSFIDLPSSTSYVPTNSDVSPLSVPNSPENPRVRPLFSETPNPFVVRKLNLDNEIQLSAQLGKRLVDIRGLLDRLDAPMLSVNERVIPESSRIEPILPTVSRPSPPVTRNPDLPTVQRLAPPSPVTSRVLTTEDAEASAAAAAADVDLLRGSADEPGIFLPPDRTPSTTGGRSYGRRGLRGNAEHFSRRAGGGPEGVRRVAEEKVGVNHEVMKRERERLCDRRWNVLRATCLATSNVIIAIVVLVMLFVIRFT